MTRLLRDVRWDDRGACLGEHVAPLHKGPNGEHDREAGVADSKGCSSAMRVAPIGLFLWRRPERLLEVARACIAGGLSGAFNGVGAIPAGWRDQVEDAHAIAGIAAALWQDAPRS